MTSTLPCLLLSLMLISLGAASFVSNVCNCHCSSPAREEATQNCVSNATIRAAMNQLRNDVQAMIDDQSSTADPGNFDLLFTASSFRLQYVSLHPSPLSPTLTALTASMWLRTNDRTTTDAGIFSYGTKNFKPRALLIRGVNPMKFIVARKEQETSITVNDGKWHHVVFTWESAGGAWQGYLDGRLVDSGSGFSQGAVISNAATIILAQEQERVSFRFAKDKAYLGLMTRVSLWDRVLGGDQVEYLFRYPSPGLDGNILKWDATVHAGIRDDVKIISPSTCQPAL